MRPTAPRRPDRSGARPPARAAVLAPALALVALAGLGGCAIGPSGGPAEPVAPPPAAPAWRPAEAMAYLLAPPPGGAHPIDDAYLARTAPWRERVAALDERIPDLRRWDKRDRGGTRSWFFDGAETVLFRIDVDEDGTVDQSQYFGPEGLFAIVHRFAGGRRTQRIWWPPGEDRIVEVRDELPPWPGVWWRTGEVPFRDPDSSGGSGDPAGPLAEIP